MDWVIYTLFGLGLGLIVGARVVRRRGACYCVHCGYHHPDLTEPERKLLVEMEDPRVEHR